VEEMATTIMATGDTTTNLEEGMVITMEVIMAIAIAMTRTGCRRILAKCYATSATTRGTMPMTALRRKQRRDSSQTRFRRDMLTMSMWRKFRRNPMLCLVRSYSINFHHWFYLIRVHHIHSYQGYLWIEIAYLLKAFPLP
jgi:hypothetical protein